MWCDGDGVFLQGLGINVFLGNNVEQDVSARILPRINREQIRRRVKRAMSRIFEANGEVVVIAIAAECYCKRYTGNGTCECFAQCSVFRLGHAQLQRRSCDGSNALGEFDR